MRTPVPARSTKARSERGEDFSESSCSSSSVTRARLVKEVVSQRTAVHRREGNRFFAQLHRIRTRGRRKFSVFDDRLRSALHHVVPHGGRGQKFPLPCFVAARLVNPQECRRRRDPLSTDRSSTKPCGRSPRGTRACLRSAPALTDPYGKQLLHL